MRPGRSSRSARFATSFQVALAFVWLFAAAFARPAWAESGGVAPVVVDEAFDERVLGRHLELAYDPGGTATIDDVLAGKLRFAPSTEDVPSFGYRGGAEWARVAVTSKLPSRATLVFVHGNGQTDELDAHRRCEGEEGASPTQLGGDHRPLSPEPDRYRFPTFRWEQATRTRCDYVFRVAGHASHQLPLTLYTRDSFERQRTADLAVQAAYFGALSAMALYNLLVFVSVRESLHLYCVALLLSYAGLQTSVGGLGFAYLWPTGGAFIDHSAPTMLGLIAITSTLFTRRLFSAIALPRAFLRVAGALLVALACLQPVASLVPYDVGVRSHAAVAPLWAAFLLGSGIAAARAGSRLGTIFLLACLASIAGVLAIPLGAFDRFPAHVVTEHLSEAASVVAFLILSFALADRMKEFAGEATRSAELAHEAVAAALEAQSSANLEFQRLDGLKDEFLANTSHELRTPLHGIIGLTEGVLRAAGGLDDASRERLGLVVASGRRLASLVSDVLDFSKLRYREVALREKSLELRGAVAMSLSVVSPNATPKALALVSDVPAGLFVRADESRLQQILINIVGNAVKFTEAGCVTVSARLEQGGRVRIAVKDTGIGVATDAQARIFESFEQADGSTAREHGGTGLGLAVTKRLVELHGGSIGIESALGTGSTFFFDLAAAYDGASDGEALESALPEGTKPNGPGTGVDWERHAELAARASGLGSIGPMQMAHDPDDSAAPRGRGVRILVADDDPVNVEVLRAQLEPEGHAVVVARDGAQAVSILESMGPFDAVLLDVMMPRLTGPQAAAEMRAHYPYGTLPIVMLTAKIRPEEAVAGLRAGADDYVGKPFHREELLARLEVHLAACRTTRALERFVRPRLVELAGKAQAGELRPGDGQGAQAILARFSLEGLGDLAARNDEHTFFECVARIVRGIVEQVEVHGGVVEAMGDDQLVALFDGEAQVALRAAERALRTARDAAPSTVRVGALLHAGHVSVGLVGADDWIAVHAFGEASVVAAAVGAWAVRADFGLVVTDAFVGNLEERTARRYLGVARVGAAGHPSSLYEMGPRFASHDDLVESLEKGDFEAVLAACEAPGDDPLVRALRDAARVHSTDVARL